MKKKRMDIWTRYLTSARMIVLLGNTVSVCRDGVRIYHLRINSASRARLLSLLSRCVDVGGGCFVVPPVLKMGKVIRKVNRDEKISILGY